MKPEFRIRKGVKINQARQASLKKQPNTPQKLAIMDANLKMVTEMEGVVNSPKNLVEISKMRKLEEARRNWNAKNRGQGLFQKS